MGSIVPISVAEHNRGMSKQSNTQGWHFAATTGFASV